MNTDQRYTILGLAGRAGAGKSTFAEAFYGEYQRLTRQTEDAAGCCIRSFADPIREIAAVLFGRGFYSAEEKAAPAPNANRVWKAGHQAGVPHLGNYAVTGRRVLQFIGTEFGRDQIYPDIWLDIFERRFHAHRGAYGVYVVPDVRFENEARMIRSLGGVVLRIVNTNLPPSTSQHPSEAGLPDGLCDGVATFESAEECMSYAEQVARQRFEMGVSDHA